jgi:hypothetical protein
MADAGELRKVLVFVRIEGQTTMDDATLERRFENFLNPEDFADSLIEEGEAFTFEQTSIQIGCRYVLYREAGRGRVLFAVTAPEGPAGDWIETSESERAGVFDSVGLANWVGRYRGKAGWWCKS